MICLWAVSSCGLLRGVTVSDRPTTPWVDDLPLSCVQLWTVKGGYSIWQTHHTMSGWSASELWTVKGVTVSDRPTTPWVDDLPLSCGLLRGVTVSDRPTTPWVDDLPLSCVQLWTVKGGYSIWQTHHTMSGWSASELWTVKGVTVSDRPTTPWVDDLPLSCGLLRGVTVSDRPTTPWVDDLPLSCVQLWTVKGGYSIWQTHRTMSGWSASELCPAVDC